MRDRNYSTRDENRNLAPWHIAALVGLAALAIGGVAAISKHRSEPRNYECLVAVDISNSNSKQIDSEFTLLELAVDQELPSGTLVSLWTFGNYPTARKVYSTTPSSGMALWDIENTASSSIVKSDSGTYPSVAFQALLSAVEKSQSNSIICLLLWDGEIGAKGAELARYAKRLAGNPKVVAIVCIGIIPDKGIRTKVEEVLSCFGNRLIVCGSCDRNEIFKLSEIIAQKSHE